MSNYQEGAGYTPGTPGGEAPYQETASVGPAAYQGGGAQGAPTTQYGTPQYASPGGQQWESQSGHQSQGHQGQGHQGQGFMQGGNPLTSPGGMNLKVRSTFKTTEFWVLVVVSLALLIAAAVTDQGNDNQSFGAHEAWKFVTWLSIAYILSRGLTKFAGHERGSRNERHDRH